MLLLVRVAAFLLFVLHKQRKPHEHFAHEANLTQASESLFYKGLEASEIGSFNLTRSNPFLQRISGPQSEVNPKIASFFEYSRSHYQELH